MPKSNLIKKPQEDIIGERLQKNIEILMGYRNISREKICISASISKTTWFCRKANPRQWEVGELIRVARTLLTSIEKLCGKTEELFI